jgi:hypothetical protein
VKGLEKCCIYSEMGETDDDMLRDDSEEDGKVRSECDDDEGTAYEDADSDTDW